MCAFLGELRQGARHRFLCKSACGAAGDGERSADLNGSVSSTFRYKHQVLAKMLAKVNEAQDDAEAEAELG